MTEEIKAGQIIEYDKDNTPHFIINGVDVSECGFLNNSSQTNLLLCDECNNDFAATECQDYTNCYYKQLKMLEQENAKLKEALEKIKNIIDNDFTKRYMELSFNEYDAILEQIEKFVRC